MNRVSYRPYFLLILFLFGLMSLPPKITEGLRSFSVASIAPSWRSLNFLKSSTLQVLAIFPQGLGREVPSQEKEREMELLRQENQLLRTQLESAKQWLLSRKCREEQLAVLHALSSKTDEDPFWDAFFKRRSQHLCQFLDLQIRSLPAQVTFREPDSWSSSVWLNVGERENQALGKKVVAKNSPVLSGTTLIGVVEQVNYGRSRVRLITDAGLAPSVRAIRGSEQNRHLFGQIEALLSTIEVRKDLFASQEELKTVFQCLHFLKQKAAPSSLDLFLAKGELHGSSHPLWRSRGQLLHGVGFNYDYPDKEGPARDLRNGNAYEQADKFPPVPLLQPGDLLVTTGLDGLFPPGLPVAIVSKISPLREGACSYELEARVAAGNLDELHAVTVLPPLEIN